MASMIPDGYFSCVLLISKLSTMASVSLDYNISALTCFTVSSSISPEKGNMNPFPLHEKSVPLSMLSSSLGSSLLAN